MRKSRERKDPFAKVVYLPLSEFQFLIVALVQALAALVQALVDLVQALVALVESQLPQNLFHDGEGR